MLENHELYFAMNVPEFDKFIVHDEPAPVVPEAEVAAGAGAAVPEAEIAAGAAANLGAAVHPSGDENRTKPPLASSQRHEVE